MTAAQASPGRRDGTGPADPPDTDEGRPVGRRIVLGMLGVGTLGVFFGKHLQDVEDAVLRPLQEHDRTGLTSLLPSGDSFRYYSVAFKDPHPTVSTYQLKVTGLVDRPVTLTFGDLQVMPQTPLVKDFQCVTGWRVPKVHWSGVALPDLLDHVGVQPAAKVVQFLSLDGTYTDTLTLSQARRRDVLVATSMLGGPVSQAHGGPVRLYVAPMYGYKSVKWLGEIQVRSEAARGYWENGGYDVDAWIGASNGRRGDAPA